jgi:hypothetical protein
MDRKAHQVAGHLGRIVGNFPGRRSRWSVAQVEAEYLVRERATPFSPSKDSDGNVNPAISLRSNQNGLQRKRKPQTEIPARFCAQTRIRAKIVLLTADGRGTAEIMQATGKAKTVIWRWQERFRDEGAAGLWRDKTRRSRIPPSGSCIQISARRGQVRCPEILGALGWGHPSPAARLVQG